MTHTDAKHRIHAALAAFQHGNLSDNALALFDTLGYNTARRLPLPDKTFAGFADYFLEGNTRFSRERARVAEWRTVDLLFQLAGDDLQATLPGFTKRVVTKDDGSKIAIESYLFFAIELTGGDYPRSTLVQITREINRVFPMPAMLLFKHGMRLTLAVINRRLHKLDASKDVLDKVTLIKDIAIANPHRAHLDILFDLSFAELRRVHPFKNFVELHDAWQQTLDTKALNKRFYQELANWYFWALSQVEFPDDAEKDAEIRNATSVIRLLTRLIFVWFLKEKQLIPEILFDKTSLATYLKYDDSTGSTYYKAILQNLFFATLNTEMRKDNPHSRKFVSRQYGVQGFYRYSRFFQEPDKALALFQEIPFLNGGLFENLDRNVGTPEETRIDCFSERPKNEPRLKVPDVLFFGEESECDFSAVYGDTKWKRERVRGLMHILNSYKFTIAENTPIEEEIALDPELLGKVFENLLASYNPETQTTARKQTGSFYTPREIVNYMVDESLIAYLTQAAQETQQPQTFAPLVSVAPVALETRLRHLLSYTDEPHQFSEAEAEALIAAINRVKILDPACGSGAFPMGMLHKMVHILTKLDPENIRWRETQRQKAIQETEQAFRMGDKEERDKRLLEINEVFEDNASDYGRKLYLIENGIYGVDIQPIAVQIAKLRCFISLIVDQQVNPAKKNLGLLPLPNLETKFVAANTLIGIAKPIQMPLQTEAIRAKEAELARVRQKHFTARSPKTKERARQDDQRLRVELADLLKSAFPADVTDKLVRWNPYDQNAHADFFDMEWMFGMPDGFDIVIGNPPYVQIQKFDTAQKTLWQQQRYQTFDRMSDLYCLFYEKGFRVLRTDGHLCYISSNKWMRTDYGNTLRQFFAEQTNPVKLIDFGNVQVFEATVDTNILLLQHAPNHKQLLACRIDKDFKLSGSLDEYVRQHSYRMTQLSNASWIVGAKDDFDIKSRVERQGVPLKDWDIEINNGIKSGSNEAFVIDGKTKESLIKKDPKNAELMKPILRGKDIKKYYCDFADLWLIYLPWHFPLHEDKTIKKCSEKAEESFKAQYPAIYEHLLNFKDILLKRDKTEINIKCEWYVLQRPRVELLKSFEKPKIIYPNMTKYLPFVYDDDRHFYSNDKSFIMTGNSLKYLVAFLNSKLFKYCFLDNFPELGNGRELRKVFFDKIPVKQIPPEEQRPFERLVDYIIFLRQQPLTTSTEYLMPVFFEQIIDCLVYELYLPDSVNKSKRAFARHLQQLPDLATQPDKMRCVSDVFTELYHQDHPIRNGVFYIDSVVEIKMIEKAVQF